VAGDPVTMWDLIAMAATEHTVEVADHPGIHTDPRLHPTRCRLFRRARVLAVHVLVARDRIKIKACRFTP